MATTEIQHQILVGGAWTDAASGETMDVINPATEEVIAEVPRCDAEDVDRAVAAAKEAYASWRAHPIRTELNPFMERVVNLEAEPQIPSGLYEVAIAAARD